MRDDTCDWEVVPCCGGLQEARASLTSAQLDRLPSGLLWSSSFPPRENRAPLAPAQDYTGEFLSLIVARPSRGPGEVKQFTVESFERQSQATNLRPPSAARRKQPYPRWVFT
jgi:hypothetical protein